MEFQSGFCGGMNLEMMIDGMHLHTTSSLMCGLRAQGDTYASVKTRRVTAWTRIPEPSTSVRF